MPHNSRVYQDKRIPAGYLRPLISNYLVSYFACGYILRRIVSLHRNPRTRKIASLTEAATGIERYCQVNGIVGGKRQNIIRHIWRRYRPVSHLWAAWSIIQDWVSGGIDPQMVPYVLWDRAMAP